MASKKGYYPAALLFAALAQSLAIVAGSNETGVDAGCGPIAMRLLAWGRPTGRCVLVGSAEELGASLRAVGTEPVDAESPPLLVLTADVAVEPAPDWRTIVLLPEQHVVLAGATLSNEPIISLKFSFGVGESPSWLRTRGDLVFYNLLLDPRVVSGLVQEASSAPGPIDFRRDLYVWSCTFASSEDVFGMTSSEHSPFVQIVYAWRLGAEHFLPAIQSSLGPESQITSEEAWEFIHKILCAPDTIGAGFCGRAVLSSDSVFMTKDQQQGRSAVSTIYSRSSTQMLLPVASTADTASAAVVPILEEKADCQTITDAARGRDYRGPVAQSKSGNRCLPWGEVDGLIGSRFGFAGVPELQGNECRNPTDHAAVWCFVETSDPEEQGEVIWEYCDVPACELPEQPRDCYDRDQDDGVSYMGSAAVTAAGDKCLPWASVDPWVFGHLEGNACRNPFKMRRDPWCFTDVRLSRDAATEVFWDFCAITSTACDDSGGGESSQGPSKALIAGAAGGGAVAVGAAFLLCAFLLARRRRPRASEDDPKGALLLPSAGNAGLSGGAGVGGDASSDVEAAAATAAATRPSSRPGSGRSALRQVAAAQGGSVVSIGNISLNGSIGPRLGGALSRLGGASSSRPAHEGGTWVLQSNSSGWFSDLGNESSQQVGNRADSVMTLTTAQVSQLLVSPERVQAVVFFSPAGLLLAVWRQQLLAVTGALRSTREKGVAGPAGLLSASRRPVEGLGPRHTALKAFPRRGAVPAEHHQQNSFAIDFDKELEPNLGAVLGEGVSAVVYKATWRGLDVAVKRFKTSSSYTTSSSDGQTGSDNSTGAVEPEIYMRNKSIRRTFFAEMELMHNVSKASDRIVRMHGACREPGKLCIVYEFMPDGCLRDYLHNTARPDSFSSKQDLHVQTLRALVISRDIAEGLAHLHPKIVHRDLKPPNILMKDGRAKIADLGLGQFKDPLNTYMQASPAGTLLYMAPEAFQNGNVSEKSDIYSLGIIMNECLTREGPWPLLMTPYQVMHAVCVEGQRPEIPEWCTGEFRQLITKCWAKDARRRPSAADVVKMLGFIIDSEHSRLLEQQLPGTLAADES